MCRKNKKQKIKTQNHFCTLLVRGLVFKKAQQKNEMSDDSTGKSVALLYKISRHIKRKNKMTVH